MFIMKVDWWVMSLSQCDLMCLFAVESEASQPVGNGHQGGEVHREGETTVTVRSSVPHGREEDKIRLFIYKGNR